MASAPPPTLPWPACLGDPAFRARVASARVLCVGAGGIGCELLKTLVLSGFKNIDVVDLDTIDVSNLNRQFLFRRSHVGASKAAVAAAAAARFAPGAAITPHRADVRSAPAFTPAALAAYTLIVNGLDNLDARRHVNRCALAARVPLVESGTAGVLGQVTVHARGDALGDGDPAATECYECAPKAPPKTFPVCTIRNTPDKPIHAVVWAKELLFARLLGPKDAVTDLDDGSAEEAAAEANGAAATPPPSAAFLRADGEDVAAYAERVFDRVFGEDVEKTRAMDDLWTKRPRPTPYRLADLLPDRGAAAAAAAAADAAVATRGVARSLPDSTDDHAPWSPAAAAAVFVGAIAAFHAHRAGDVGAASFDKDDRLAAELVAAATVLRCAGHAIPPPSFFDARGAAGNIVHAVATTNAVVAGLVVVEALKLVARAPAPRLRATFLFAAPSAGRLLAAGPPPPPAPGCAVCGTAGVRVSLDTAATTLGELVDKVLKSRLAMVEPTLAAPGGFLYEEGADLEEDEVQAYTALRPLTLASLPGGGLTDGVVLTVTDNAQAVTVAVTLAHAAPWDKDKHPDGFTLEGEAPRAAATEDGGEAGGAAAGATAEASSSGFEVVEEGGEAEVATRAAAAAPAPAAEPEEAAPPADAGRPTRKRKAAAGAGGGRKRK